MSGGNGNGEVLQRNMVVAYRAIPPECGTWKGQPLTCYTKDELVEIADRLGRLYHEALARHAADITALVPYQEGR